MTRLLGRKRDAGAIPTPVRWGLLAVLGLGAGFSPAFFGYFDMSVWGPLALGLIALAIGL